MAHVLSVHRPPVSLVVVNFNGMRFLDELFQSFTCQTLTDFEVLFVDNGSQDESVAQAKKIAPRTRVIGLPTNRRFAAAGNLGVKSAAGEFVALLNTDLKLDSGWLAAMMDAFSEGDIAAVACKVLLYDRNHLLNGVGGSMNCLGYTWDRGMLEPDRGQYDQPAEVLFAPACAALFRRQAFLEAGGFDERFFMYHEDVDLGWRLWLFGHRIITAPAAVAYHHFGGSTQVERGMSWRERIGERNAMSSLIKNYEWPNAVRSLTRMLLLRQSPRRKLGQLSNLLWNVAHLPGTLLRRQAIQSKRCRKDTQLRGLIVQSPNVAVRF